MKITSPSKDSMASMVSPKSGKSPNSKFNRVISAQIRAKKLTQLQSLSSVQLQSKQFKEQIKNERQFQLQPQQPQFKKRQMEYVELIKELHIENKKLKQKLSKDANVKFNASVNVNESVNLNYHSQTHHASPNTRSPNSAMMKMKMMRRQIQIPKSPPKHFNVISLSQNTSLNSASLSSPSPFYPTHKRCYTITNTASIPICSPIQVHQQNNLNPNINSPYKISPSNCKSPFKKNNKNPYQSLNCSPKKSFESIQFSALNSQIFNGNQQYFSDSTQTQNLHIHEDQSILMAMQKQKQQTIIRQSCQNSMSIIGSSYPKNWKQAQHDSRNYSFNNHVSNSVASDLPIPSLFKKVPTQKQSHYPSQNQSPTSNNITKFTFRLTAVANNNQQTQTKKKNQSHLQLKLIKNSSKDEDVNSKGDTNIAIIPSNPFKMLQAQFDKLYKDQYQRIQTQPKHSEQMPKQMDNQSQSQFKINKNIKKNPLLSSLQKKISRQFYNTGHEQQEKTQHYSLHSTYNQNIRYSNNRAKNSDTDLTNQNHDKNQNKVQSNDEANKKSMKSLIQLVKMQEQIVTASVDKEQSSNTVQFSKSQHLQDSSSNISSNNMNNQKDDRDPESINNMLQNSIIHQNYNQKQDSKLKNHRGNQQAFNEQQQNSANNNLIPSEERQKLTKCYEYKLFYGNTTNKCTTATSNGLQKQQSPAETFNDSQKQNNKKSQFTSSFQQTTLLSKTDPNFNNGKYNKIGLNDSDISKSSLRSKKFSRISNKAYL